MASIRGYGFDDLENKFNKLYKGTAGIAIGAVNASLPTLEKSFKQHINAAADRGYSTGELERSVMSENAKENQYGVFGVSKVTGVAKTGIPRAEQLALLEYGNGRQTPKPVRAPTVAACSAKIKSDMETFVNKEITNVMGE